MTTIGGKQLLNTLHGLSHNFERICVFDNCIEDIDIENKLKNDSRVNFHWVGESHN